RCFIEKRNPICAAISRLPNSSGNCAEVIGVRFAYDTFDRQCASTAERTDLSPPHSTEQLFVDCSRRYRSRGTSRLNRSCRIEKENSQQKSNQRRKTVTRRNHPPIECKA